MSSSVEDAISSLPSLREVIRSFGIEPKRSFGQNFILDNNLLAKIVRIAGNVKNKAVIEVGPGPGGLTRQLLLAGSKVTVIEKDNTLYGALHELRFAVGEDLLSVIEGDALSEKEEDILAEKITIVSNLPYNIATELLFKWLDKISIFEKFVLMFQKEVADRIMASPGSKEYGRLSVYCQWLCDIQHGFDIPPSAFTPPPKVTSSVILLTPREEPLGKAHPEILKKVLKAAFGQRRKMLRSSLKQISEDPETILNAALIEPTLRAENLTVEQFCSLSRAYEYWQSSQ